MKARPWWLLILGLMPAGYLVSGVTVLQPDEIGMVRRFGAVLAEPWQPGLHWGLPWGIDQVDRIQINQVRTLSVGAPGSGAAPLARAPEPAFDDFLTGDLNLVTAETLVQYRVRDPVLFLFRAREVEASLSAMSRWAVTRALAGRGIDELLSTGRAEAGEGMRRSIQSSCDEAKLGISVVAVRLGRLAPPVAVAPAFADAARARSDRRQAITRALEYCDRAEADSRGQAREIADSAAGRFDRLVQPALGEAERFTKVLAEARKSPDAARRRFYLETLGELLPRFRRKIVVATGQDLDISLLGEE
jgi:membrane protease subunit HflK